MPFERDAAKYMVFVGVAKRAAAGLAVVELQAGRKMSELY